MSGTRLIKWISGTNKPFPGKALVIAVFIPLSLTMNGSAQAQSLVGECLSSAKRGLLHVPDDRSLRFMGKVQEDTALCRGGKKATQWKDTPWG